MSDARGRRPGSYAVGIDLGGTRMKLLAVTDSGEELARATERVKNEPRTWRDAIHAWIAGLEQRLGSYPTHVGIGAPGLVAPDGSSIVWMQGRLDGLQGLVWSEHLGLASPVALINDAQAALLAEAWIGAARDRRNVVLLTIGTGVGGAVLVDGRLLLGQAGRAGHLGHISLDADGPPDIVGTPGSLEDAIGDCTISRRSGGRFTTTEELVSASQAGDPEAQAIWLRSVRRLACGIVSLINVLDPEVIVLGGGITRSGPALFQPLARFLDRLEWRPLGKPTPIVPAALGEFAGAFGAARHALTRETP